jgi:hypothetical protein
MIVVGSTIKGVIAGVLIGFFARKVHSLTLGILFGLAVGLLLAFFVAHMQHGYYFRHYASRRPGGLDCGLCHTEIWRVQTPNALPVLNLQSTEKIGIKQQLGK